MASRTSHAGRAVTFQGGRVDRTLMPVASSPVRAASGRSSSLRASKVGERLYGVGRVVRVSGDQVTVEYKQRRAGATAVYDRDTGWLIEMRGGDPRRRDFTLIRR